MQNNLDNENPVVLDRATILRLQELDPSGSSGLIQKLVDLYLQTSDEIIKNLQNDFIQSDMDRFKACAHKFKSTNANLGLMRMAKLLQKLENNALTENYPELIKQLDLESQLAIAALQSIKQEFCDRQIEL